MQNMQKSRKKKSQKPATRKELKKKSLFIKNCIIVSTSESDENESSAVKAHNIELSNTIDFTATFTVIAISSWFGYNQRSMAIGFCG